MMKICSIASSSSGNCIYVGSDNTHILIDAGISGKRVKAGLNSIGVEPESIDAVLITHEHSDHIKGLGVISRKYNIPIYATEPTWRKIISSKLTGTIDEMLFHEITPDSKLKIKEIDVHPFSTSHDAVEPVCYTFTKKDKKISVATDLGCYDSYTKEHLKDSNILFIEANHDIEMLENGSYPYYIKERILSDEGHLSNETSGRLISELFCEKLQYILLGHLSRENNDPKVAGESVKKVLETCDNISMSGVELIVSKKEEITGLITI